MRGTRKFTGWLVGAAALGGYLVFMAVQMTQHYLSSSSDVRTIRALVTSEELILQLNPELGKLSLGVLNLKLPGYDGTALFERQVEVTDLASDVRPVVARELATVAVQVRQWPLANTATAGDAHQLDLWRPLLSQVTYFEHAKFYFINGQFTSEQFDEFSSEIGFQGLARMESGQWSGVKARQHVLWKRAPSTTADAPPVWRIAAWDTQSMQTVDSHRLLFTEVLDHALPNTRDLRRARESRHEQEVIEYYAAGAKKLPSRYFSPISANLKPGLSVVDIDNDGFDDLYIAVRLGRNQLLRNRGDGTFEEVAARFGLDIDGHSTCAIFADFDNDGDQDLMLGRSLERSMYLENVGQRFRHRELTFGGQQLLPYLAVSMSAADYNGDGLLDVYISTYRPAVLENIVSHEQNLRDEDGLGHDNPLRGIASQAKHWPDEFLTEQQARQYFRLHADEETDGTGQPSNVLDQAGPPNVLLVNLGEGRFALAPENNQLGLWRNSLQATWADFDEDGDPDIYVANDWADDILFRNDGPKGFVDVTQETGTNLFGFAMGATWGDYDNDGLQDLYVSNMYSKAGRRITARIADLNPDYVRSVEGNYLYRQIDGKFELVSGLEPPALTVADAGWSWGGQFTDIDNDGFLDIYVLSGYFTAPKEFSSNLDL